MKKRFLVLLSVLILGLALLPASALGLDQTTPVDITCNSTGPTCATAFEYTFTLSDWATGEAAYTVPDSHGVPISITLSLDGVAKLTKTLGYAGDTTGLPLSTGPVDLGLLNPGDHTVTIAASLLDPEADFSSWGGTFHIATTAYSEAVAIKVKPFDAQPIINPLSSGKVLVAVLSTENFAAPEVIDAESLTFGVVGTEESLAYCTAFPQDVNDDGLADLTCLFRTEDLGIETTGQVLFTLLGETLEGMVIVGTDTVQVLDVPVKKGLERKYQNQVQVLNTNEHKDSGQWTDQEQEALKSLANCPVETGPKGSGNNGGSGGSGGGGGNGGK